MNDQTLYASKWHSYKRNRLFFFFLFLAWIPFVRGVSYFVETLHVSVIIGDIFGIAWIVVMFIQGSRLALWPCPRCGKSFRGWFPYLRKRCSHCNLPRWAQSSGE